jgi:transcriptional regulator with XRE-family HTH domain
MKDRINFIIQKLDISKSKFAERLNVSQAFVSQMTSGEREPSDRTIQDICREFGVNEVWLRTGKGDPFKERTLEETIMRFAVQTNKGSDDFRKAYVAMLANLSDDGWKGLQEMYDKLSEIYKKE